MRQGWHAPLACHQPCTVGFLASSPDKNWCIIIAAWPAADSSACNPAPPAAQIDYKNTHGLALEALEGRGIGFAGKQVIHPAQIGGVQAGPASAPWGPACLRAYTQRCYSRLPAWCVPARKPHPCLPAHPQACTASLPGSAACAPPVAAQAVPQLGPSRLVCPAHNILVQLAWVTPSPRVAHPARPSCPPRPRPRLALSLAAPPPPHPPPHTNTHTHTHEHPHPAQPHTTTTTTTTSLPPHPVCPQQEAFSPDPHDVHEAHELVAAFERHQQEGTGAFTFK